MQPSPEATIAASCPRHSAPTCRRLRAPRNSAQFGANILTPATPLRYTFIDAEATQGPSTSLDGFDGVQTWYHARPRHGQFAAGNMTWVVKPGQSGGAPRLLRTSYLTEYPPAGYINGQRDFNSNHTVDVEKELNPPAGVKCTSHGPPPPEDAFAWPEPEVQFS